LTFEINIYVEGKYSIALDGAYMHESLLHLKVPAGKHEIIICASNETSVPSIFVQGREIVSDGSWEVCFYDTNWVGAGSWNLNDPAIPPSKYRLAAKEINPDSIKKSSGTSMFIDFGKETFGYVKLSGISGKGKIALYYGESPEEALAIDTCETFDKIDNTDGCNNIEFEHSRALRYINIHHDKDIDIQSVSLMYEYLPLEYKGKFKCSNEMLNIIWDTAVYTLHLNTREFLLDGIKRDRWVWSGDAYQSFLMNYYIFFDKGVNKRTLFALRGKDPVDMHLNTIMDYSFYWFMGFYDYYLYTGDIDFVNQNYNRMVSLMDFCPRAPCSQRLQRIRMQILSELWILMGMGAMKLQPPIQMRAGI
jgi:hypothetical protein